MKYTMKTPPSVEAFRLGVDPIPDWFMDKVTTNEIILHGTSSGFEHHDDTTADINFGNHIIHVDFGDYVIKFDNDIIYKCGPDTFENIYEPVVEVNSYGVNKAIKYHILSDEKMIEIGFRKISFTNQSQENKSTPQWSFWKTLQFPNEKRWKYTEISFNVHIIDGFDLRIEVLDDHFMQPYDYQFLLEKNPRNECALIVKEQVEKWMKYLQDKDVLSGHNYGEYI